MDNLDRLTEDCLTCQLVKTLILHGKSAGEYAFRYLRYFGLLLMGIVAAYKYHTYFQDRMLSISSGTDDTQKTTEIFKLTMWLVVMSVFLTTGMLSPEETYSFVLTFVNSIFSGPFLAMGRLLSEAPGEMAGFFASDIVQKYCTTDFNFSQIETHYGCVQASLEEAAFLPITVAVSEIFTLDITNIPSALLAVVILFLGFRILSKALTFMILGVGGLYLALTTMPIWLALLPFDNMRGPTITALKFFTRFGAVNLATAIVIAILGAFINVITMTSFGVPASAIQKDGFLELIDHDLLDLDVTNIFFFMMLLYTLVANELISTVNEKTQEFADSIFDRFK